MTSDHVYSSPQITITRDYIRLPNGEREAIAISTIHRIDVHRVQVGDHNRAAAGFLVLGVLSVWFMIGFLFLALGVAALFIKVYLYRLTVWVGRQEVLLLEDKRRSKLMSLARTIRGLITSRQTLAKFISTN